MKLRKVLSIMTIVMVSFMSLVSFVGCSNEINESTGSAAVSFTTSVSKALNQSGLVNSDVEDKVESYYWMYYVGLDEPAKNDDGNFNDMDWQKFSDKSEARGLGTIPGLMKGESYYFGLRGYKTMNETSKDFEDLIWEGFHYTDGTTASINAVNFEKVKLVSKNQLVTVDVYTAGVGRLYFCISAPAVAGFSTTGSYVVNNKVQYDYFTYNIKSLDTTEIITSDTNLYIENTYTSDTDVKCYKESDQTFYYSDLLEDGNTSVPTGTYLMTIWQNSYDTESKTYKAVSQRKQVLLINILSGVNTIVTGTLDSTSLDTFNYEADGWVEGSTEHMHVIFHYTEPDDVTPLDVTVIDDKRQAVSYTSPSNIIEVGNFNGKYNRPLTNDFIEIKPVENTDIMIYINGIEVNKDSSKSSETLNVAQYKLTEDDFLVRTRKGAEETTYVQLLQDDAGQYYVRAFGKLDYQYILTIRKSTNPQESVSFTITGKTASERATVAVTGIKLKTTETSIAIGESVQLREVVLPENATNDNVTWSSSDETIATVDENGVVTATGNGTATITAKTEDGAKTATATVKVLNYLTFSSTSSFKLGTSSCYATGLESSIDKTTWTAFKANGSTMPSVTAKQADDGKYYVYLRGDGMTSLAYIDDENSDNNVFTTLSITDYDETAGVDCSGNIMALLDWDNSNGIAMDDYAFAMLFQGCTALKTAPSLPATELSEFCYYGTFLGCTSLTTAPVLPATTLASNCYCAMFAACTSLTTAPALPATTLASCCYQNMFYSCTSLATAPALAATKLASNCYENMFQSCLSLTTAPALPATELVDKDNKPAKECYFGMFEECRNLTTAPALPATTLSSHCYYGMFKGCESLTTAPALPATTLTKYCYYSMFEGCVKLTTLQIPEGKTQVLPAESVNVLYCYNQMFKGCADLKITADSTQSGAVKIFTCPNASTSDLSNLVNSMFTGTAGDAPDTPVANTTYYFY